MPWWARLLQRMGITVLDVSAYRLDPDAAAEGRYVVLHDDDVSPLATVIEWAARTFELDAAEAAVKVAAVQRRGYAAFGPFAEDDVQRLLERGATTASALGLTALRYDTQVPQTPDDSCQAR